MAGRRPAGERRRKLGTVAVDTSRGVDGAPAGELERRTIKRIELRSVLKFSVLLSATVGLILMLAGGVLYFIATTTGFVTTVQTFFNHYGYPDFRFQTSTVFGVMLIVVAAGAIFWVILAAVATVIFNLVAEASGGIKMTVQE
jgi:hypothetical protein